MRTTEFPSDIEAEEEVIGTVIGLPTALSYVDDLLSVDDFYDVRHARIWVAAEQLTDMPARIVDDDEGFVASWNQRIEAVAQLAAVSPSYVAELERSRSVMENSRTWAKRVAAATRRRRAMLELADAYNALAAGAEVDEVAQHLASRTAFA